MRHWLQLATRNWRVRPGRTAAAIVAVALGVGTVVSITCFYESVRQSISDRVVGRWLGRSHLSLEPPLGHWGQVKQTLTAEVTQLDNVAHVSARLMRRMNIGVPSKPSAGQQPDPAAAPPDEEADAIGIDPATEYLFRDFEELVGRRIEPGDAGVAMIEKQTAQKYGLAVGDTVRLSVPGEGPQERFTVVGLFAARRVAKFQRPNVIVPLADLQRLRNEPGTVTAIDVMLRDHSVESVTETTRQVRERMATLGEDVQVTSAAARLEQLQEAERVTQMVLVLVAFVAMLTSFFIILTTMSMGVVERIGQLGLMRCVGLTRGQLAGLVMLEVLPLGLIGIVLGLPIGFGVTRLGAAMIPEYIQGVAVSRWGMGLAVAGGAITTLLSAAVLIFQVGRVSPLSAANPEASPAPRVLAVVAAAFGVALILLHNGLIAYAPTEVWLHPAVAFAGVASVYGGYVLLAPALALTVGTGVISLVAPALRLRRRLARDQIGRAPWRSAGVCWMLMVGLSLIVHIAARGESVIAAWDFPKKLPESFVWSWEKASTRTRPAVEAIPGVGACTVVNDFLCKLTTRSPQSAPADPSGWLNCTFVAGELDKFLSMARLSFVEGSPDEVIAKLRRGGYVIIPPEAAHGLGLKLGDKVQIALGRRRAEFEVAGVVQSPALDIAVTYFQADSYMMRAAAGSVIGTVDDAKRCFGIDSVSMYMLNVDLPPSERPAAFDAAEAPPMDYRTFFQAIVDWQPALPAERATLEKVVPQVRARLADPSAPLDAEAQGTLQRFRLVMETVTKEWHSLNPENRWDLFRERLVLQNVAVTMGRPSAIIGSLRHLKQQIDRDIRDVCRLMTAMPAVALAVAALGVANLMMVSVTTRTRQIAVLRAVGATRSQIVRLVFAEAITLGVLGCVAGVALGIHVSHSAAAIAERFIGIPFPLVIPWPQVAVGVALTLGVCILAGIGPARHAARNNIIDAMQAF